VLIATERDFKMSISIIIKIPTMKVRESIGLFWNASRILANANKKGMHAEARHVIYALRKKYLGV
jgi:hypothetical protein